MNHKPVCKKCECEMRPETNGIGLLDMFTAGDKPGPQPYQIWDTDLWKCPRCGIEVVLGFAAGPISRPCDEDFSQLLESYTEKGKLIKNFE